MTDKDDELSRLSVPRSDVLQRDNYICQSCRKRFRANMLSVHHILPRAESGTNDMLNLITLCNPCHDMIEIAEPPIRTKQEILFHKQSLDELDEDCKEIDDRDNNRKKDWYKWVYGSGKRPKYGDEK